MGEIEILTVSERGQIVLPKKTREKLRVSKGTKLMMFEKGGSITLTKVENIIKVNKLSGGAETFLASQKTLSKDWGYSGDDVWNEL